MDDSADFYGKIKEAKENSIHLLYHRVYLHPLRFEYLTLLNRDCEPCSNLTDCFRNFLVSLTVTFNLFNMNKSNGE